MELMEKYPVAVLGAGPIGLAAAAHLLDRGLTPIVFEASDTVGASFRDFGHVKLFSPWRYNIDRACRKILDASGWKVPDDDAVPSAGDLLHRYLLPLANSPRLKDKIELNSRVISVARKGYDKVKSEGRDKAPFVVRVEANGITREFLAGAVIDATGNWFHPNPLGANGLPAIGEDTVGSHIDYGMPDIEHRMRSRYSGKTTVVVGGGHSAVGSLVSLAELAKADPRTRIHWVLRGNSLARAFGGGTADQLPARGALGIKLRALVDDGTLRVHQNFRIREVREEDGSVTVIPEEGFENALPIYKVDEIICATGSRPDLDIVRELRVRTDAWLESTEALAPLIDPNLHSCGTVRPHGHKELAHPEPGFYIVGAKSYGRAPTFLLATGYEQVRSVAAALVGDMAAADDVRLDLPETGVCITDFGGGGTGGGCCTETPLPDAEPSQAGAGIESCGCGPVGSNSNQQPASACCG